MRVDAKNAHFLQKERFKSNFILEKLFLLIKRYLLAKKLGSGLVFLGVVKSPDKAVAGKMSSAISQMYVGSIPNQLLVVDTNL